MAAAKGCSEDLSTAATRARSWFSSNWSVGRTSVSAGVPFVASPVHKHGFDLRTGQCLDDPHVTVADNSVTRS